MGRYRRELEERRRVETALKESEKRTRGIFNAVSDAVFLHPYAEKGFALFEDVNETACERYGYSRAEFRKLTVQDVTRREREFARSAQSHLLRLAETGQLIFEAIHITKAGEEFPVEVKAVVVELNRRAMILSVARDISERKERESRREELEAQLRHAQKLEAVGTLAGGIAHDFNNVLTAITGFSELGLRAAREGRSPQRQLGQILKAAERSKELVRQILTFSHKVDFRLVPLDLNQEIAGLKEILERTIPKMIGIELNLAEDLEPILGDANQLEQILLNLATNAKDAMPDGGRLTIETRAVSLDEEHCRENIEASPGDFALIRVSDTGSGMNPEVVDHIFDPFFTTKEVGKGTGLGLSSVFGIVRGHGGHITVRSELDRGTVFSIYIPFSRVELSPQEDSGAEQPGTGLQPEGGTELILLVDDEESIREIGDEILSVSGYRVLTAPDGEAALEIFLEMNSTVDLVVLDLGMPGMGGQQCLQELLEIDPGVKVLIASGYLNPGRFKEALEAGAVGFIPKPFKMVSLLTAVRQALDR